MKRKALSIEVTVESRTRNPRRGDGVCRAQGWGRTWRSDDDMGGPVAGVEGNKKPGCRRSSQGWIFSHCALPNLRGFVPEVMEAVEA